MLLGQIRQESIRKRSVKLAGRKWRSDVVNRCTQSKVWIEYSLTPLHYGHFEAVLVAGYDRGPHPTSRQHVPPDPTTADKVVGIAMPGDCHAPPIALLGGIGVSGPPFSPVEDDSACAVARFASSTRLDCATHTFICAMDGVTNTCC